MHDFALPLHMRLSGMAALWECMLAAMPQWMHAGGNAAVSEHCAHVARFEQCCMIWMAVKKHACSSDAHHL